MAGDAVAICLELLYTLLVLIECEPSRRDVEKKPKEKREKVASCGKIQVAHCSTWRLLESSSVSCSGRPVEGGCNALRASQFIMGIFNG